MDFAGTIWSLLPPVVAIGLALITKEVYISLFVGVLTGAVLTAFTSESGIILGSIETTFEAMIENIGDAWNVGILIFLVFLGILVALMTRAGGSAAYGRWASNKIKSKKTALFATFGLGVLIFVDDYFNCLTVGNVMRPVTDKYKVSRSKLAYIIDATAAPVCIIAPISSWAAAVTGYTEGDGFRLFLSTIPFNLYALLTIAMVIAMIALKFDFGPMRRHEKNAEETGDLFSGGEAFEKEETIEVSEKGKVIDLVLPVIVLIISCIAAMVYTGGFFSGKGIGFIQAFADCDASLGLVYGSFIALVFTFILYMSRRVIKFKEFAACIPKGFRLMASAILILCLAWTLGSLCRDYLNAGEFVYNALAGNTIGFAIFPTILFLVAMGLAFSTGTSWGTFGVLIPIVTAVFPSGAPMLVIAIAAVLAGAVCGDHISPISDTTIMASTGAQCDHVNHVSTQIPYALTVAACCLVGYLVAGFTESLVLTLITGFGCLAIAIGVLYFLNKRKASAPEVPEEAEVK